MNIKRFFTTIGLADNFTKKSILTAVCSAVGIVVPAFIAQHLSSVLGNTIEMLAVLLVTLGISFGNALVLISCLKAHDVIIYDLSRAWKLAEIKQNTINKEKIELPDNYGKNFLVTKSTNVRIYLTVMKNMRIMVKNYIKELERDKSL